MPQSLDKMFRSGWIEAFSEERAAFFPDGAELECMLIENGPIIRSSAGPVENPSCHYYRLTAAGGEIWRRLPRPAWAAYVNIDYGDGARWFLRR